MQLSVYYQSKYKAKADELTCPYNKLGYIEDFIRQYPNKRYILTVERASATDFSQLFRQADFISSITQNYSIQCKDMPSYQILRNHQKRYQIFYDMPAYNWDMLNILADFNPTDILISGPLRFQVDKLVAFKENKNIKLRILPFDNYDERLFTGSDKITSFYLRPEDMCFYEPAIDILHLPNDAYFPIYSAKFFPDSLNILNPNLESKAEVNNMCIPPMFGKLRANCGQKCQIPGYNCRACENALAAAKIDTINNI